VRADAGYVELHCHSCYSLREGASTPVELLRRAAELGMDTLALTDHDGLYGAMEFAQAARVVGIHAITGAELTLTNGHHLTILAETRQGYANLCRLITHQRMTSPRERPVLDPAYLAEHTAGLIALSGCCRGEIPALTMTARYNEAEMAAEEYVAWFGKENFFIELQQNLVHGDTRRNARLVDLAGRLGVGIVATNNVHYHERGRHRLHDVLVAVRHRLTLDSSHRQRRANDQFYLKPHTEMAELFRQYPAAITTTRRIAERCTFNLAADLDYTFPDYTAAGVAGGPPVPADVVLEQVCRQRLGDRYSRLEPRRRREAEERLDEELRLIRKHGLAGFFLCYRDILQLSITVATEVYERPVSRPPGRGRGSSVGSIVCYLIGLSHIDPLAHGLFLGRFLNEELISVPDIDLDFPREIRARLIERMYTHFGEEHVGLLCSFSTYQLRSAVRDVGLALGIPRMMLDPLAKQLGHLPARYIKEEMARLPDYRDRLDAPVWDHLIDLVPQLDGFPRHLSQHVGGMVISSEPIRELVPQEPAAMDGRVLLQWDKDSVEDARFIKIDFLALGMLSLVDECLDLIAAERGQPPDLGRVPHDDERVFDAICQGDTIGAFQIESRAQIQTLPRTQPRTMEDLIVEVAIIRPGPVVGGSVNPYIQRRQGREPVTYDHASLEPVLAETLGVILYQEQVLQVAIAAANFSAGQAESLRRALSRKRSAEAIRQHWPAFRDGALANGLEPEQIRTIFRKLLAFSGYGFPKSHSAAFALLAYESMWLKFYYPTPFYTALLNSQPMGFYSPDVIAGDARRHGVRILGPDINRSGVRCTIEGRDVRLGLAQVDGLGGRDARPGAPPPTTPKRIVAEREERGLYRSLYDVLQRTGLNRKQIQNLIEAGVFDEFGLHRRELSWQLGLLVARKGSQLALNLPTDQSVVSLPEQSSWERVADEYAMLGLSPSDHPLRLMRRHLHEGIVSSVQLERLPDGSRVQVAGMVVCRQRPETAKGFTFLSLEDEEGLSNVIVRPQLAERARQVLRHEAFLLVSGQLQRKDGTTNVLAHTLEPLTVPQAFIAPRSKDWGR